MRRLALFAVGFGAAALLGCYLVPLGWMVGAGACAALAGVLLWLIFKGKARRVILLLAGLAAGFFWFRGWTALRLAPVEDLAGTTGPVRALVTDYPRATDYGQRVDVILSGVPALLYTRGDGAELAPGDEIAVTAELRRADVRREEATTVFTSRGYFLLAYAREELEVRRPDAVPPLLLPRVWARALRERIPDLFPGDASGLIAAVLLGDKSLLSSGDSSALSRAGLAHATAVSGMHIGFLTQMLILLCRHRRRAAGLVIPALVLFALITGAHPGTVRAVVMQTVMLCGLLLRRDSDTPTALGLALLLLLLWNPYAAASMGLQLSFSAVAGILLVIGPVMSRLWPLYGRYPETGWGSIPGKVKHFFCGVFAASLGATLFTAPLSALYLGSVSLAGVLANLLCLWAVSGLFIFALPAVLAGLLSPALGKILGLPALFCARWVLWIARGLGRLNFAALPLDIPYYRLWLGSIYALVGVYCLLRRRGFSPLFPLCCGVLLLLAAVGLARADYGGRPLTVTALDVGQGASTLFLTGGRAVLVDCGGNELQNAGDTAADWLQSLGVTRLDLLVLTHFDNDHFNGIEALFARMDISAVAIPRLEEDPTGRREDLYAWAAAEGAQVTALSELSRVELGEAVFTLFPPLGRGSSNEAGVMVLCTLGDFDALVTGDADASIEALLVERFDLPDLELLAVGHHGSRHSTSADFLAATRPEIALISCGENAYGHPDPEVLERLEAVGAVVLRTDTQGAVTVTVG